LIMPQLVSQADIEIAMRRAMTAPEAAASSQLVDSITSLLELYLNRDLTVKTFTSERHVVGIDGHLRFYLGPVQSVVGVQVGVDGTPITDYNTNWWDPIFGQGTTVFLTYTAGDLDVPDYLKQLIINGVAKSVLVNPQIAVGAIGHYSVEGTSIQYTVFNSRTDQGGVGQFTVADVTPIKRLKRPVGA